MAGKWATGMMRRAVASGSCMWGSSRCSGWASQRGGAVAVAVAGSWRLESCWRAMSSSSSSNSSSSGIALDIQHSAASATPGPSGGGGVEGEQRPELELVPLPVMGEAGEQTSGLTVSAAAAQRLKALQAKKGQPDLKLRVWVDDGGCSGYTYNFELSEEVVQEDDTVFTRDGVEVLVDSISLPFLEGATLDLEASIIKQGFAITSNPNAEKGCGCGSSFAPRMD